MAWDRVDGALGALLGTFVGDALGMPFEGRPPGAVPDRVEMVDARLGRGTYTDDTEMTILLAESLLEHGSVREDRLAETFLAGCDPARGYGAGTLEVLAQWRRGVPVGLPAGNLFGGQGSRGNGAAMRIAPVAVRYADAPNELREQAERSAQLTHAHPLAIDAAVVQASAIAAALRGDDVLEAAAATATSDAVQDRLERVGELGHAGPADAAAALGNTAVAEESVPTAIYAAVSHRRFEDAVSFAVRCGGDTDTIGAMAGAIAGGRDGASAIPGRWLAALEDGQRGRSHMERLARALVS